VTAPAPSPPVAVPTGVEPVPSQAGANATAPRNVSPQELEAHRIRGDKMIVPDDVDKAAIAASGKNRVVASFKLCVDDGGNVIQVTLLKSCGFPGYDRKILSEMAGWQYSPVEIDGTPVPVCSAVTFIYSQR
jgi:outer membrane biosynthesis protein TonB